MKKVTKTEVHNLKIGDKVLALYDRDIIYKIIDKQNYIPIPKNPLRIEPSIKGGTEKHSFSLLLENKYGKAWFNYTYDVIFEKVDYRE